MRSSPTVRDFVTLRLVAVLGALVALAAAMPASAGDCGDKMEGGRVACSCGDNVVTDTTLKPGDPVVSRPCSGDALMLFPPSNSDGITLDLGGLSIQGTGSGSGIKVLRGGKLGSLIVGGGDANGSRAAIYLFSTGIRASGRSLLREVRDLDVHDNKHDGLQIRTSGVKVSNVNSYANGRDGVVVSGHGNEVTGVVAKRNQRDGLQVRGTGAGISAETSDNRRNGTTVGGRGNDVTTVQSTGNGGAGLHANGADHSVGKIDSSGNSVDVAGRPGALK